MVGVLPYMYTRRSTHRPFISLEPVSLEITTKSVSTAIWMPDVPTVLPSQLQSVTVQIIPLGDSGTTV